MPGPMGPSRTVNGKSPASSPPTRPKNWFKYWTTRSSVRDSHLPGSLRELPSHDTGWRRNRAAVERAAVAGPPAHRAGPSTYRGSPSPLAGVDVAVMYLFQRLVQGVLVLLGVTTIVFALTFVAGDPASTLAPLDTTPAELEQFRHNMGLDRPVPVQYLDFLVHAVRGDFGMSYSSHEPAMGIVLERLPATLRLTGAAVLFALVIAVPLGLLAAMNHDRWIDSAARFFAFLGQSIPVFLLGMVLILVFAVGLRWLPSSGGESWKSLILPAISVGAFSAAVLARLLRSSLLEVLSQEYIRTAYAKGLRGRAVVVRHALRRGRGGDDLRLPGDGKAGGGGDLEEGRSRDPVIRDGRRGHCDRRESHRRPRLHEDRSPHPTQLRRRAGAPSGPALLGIAILAAFVLAAVFADQI